MRPLDPCCGAIDRARSDRGGHLELGRHRLQKRRAAGPRGSVGRARERDRGLTRRGLSARRPPQKDDPQPAGDEIPFRRFLKVACLRDPAKGCGLRAPMPDQCWRAREHLAVVKPTRPSASKTLAHVIAPKIETRRSVEPLSGELPADRGGCPLGRPSPSNRTHIRCPGRLNHPRPPPTANSPTATSNVAECGGTLIRCPGYGRLTSIRDETSQMRKIADVPNVAENRSNRREQPRIADGWESYCQGRAFVRIQPKELPIVRLSIGPDVVGRAGCCRVGRQQSSRFP